MILKKRKEKRKKKTEKKEERERDKYNNIGRIRVNGNIHIFKVPKYKLILFLSHYC